MARGRLTEETLSNIHQKRLDDLAEIDATIDGIYYCPHNWDEGCFCRKPRPGLLYQIQRDANLNSVEDCLLIGDDDRDIEAAHRARCAAIQVSESYSLADAVNDLLANHNTTLKS